MKVTLEKATHNEEEVIYYKVSQLTDKGMYLVDGYLSASILDDRFFAILGFFHKLKSDFREYLDKNGIEKQ